MSRNRFEQASPQPVQFTNDTSTESYRFGRSNRSGSTICTTTPDHDLYSSYRQILLKFLVIGSIASNIVQTCVMDVWFFSFSNESTSARPHFVDTSCYCMDIDEEGQRAQLANLNIIFSSPGQNAWCFILLYTNHRPQLVLSQPTHSD